MRDPLWKSTTILLKYKRLIAVAMLGAFLSAASFGGGVALLAPTLKILRDQSIPLADQVRHWLVRPDRWIFVQDFGDWLARNLPDDRYHIFLLVLISITFLSVIGSCGRYLHQLMTITVVQRAAMVWRGRMYRQVIHIPLIEQLRVGSADHISRVVFDTRPLMTAYRALLGKTVEQVLRGAAAICVALFWDVGLTLIGLICAPVIAILLQRFGKRVRRATRRVLRTRGRMVGALRESTGAIRVVKVHNAEGYERRRFRRINREQYDQEMKIRSARALASPLIGTLGLFFVILVAGIAGYHIFRNENMDSEGSITVIVSLGLAASALRPLANLNHQLNEGRAAAKRMFELLAMPVEPMGKHRPQKTMPLPRHCQTVTLENLSFRYDDESQPVIDDVCLEIPFGQTVAIVGANGSGKTTLLNFIPRLLTPHSGRVLIDGIDIKTVRLRPLREQIAVVTQQSILFEGSIADNIAYGRHHATEEMIIDAAKTAHADEFIRALPEGYKTMLGEHGEGLSGGQRQRVCIARAILRNPAILILDEATSQIDADSEAKINQALRDIRRGRTVFVVAHRLSTVIDVDQIVVLDRGRVIDQGKHTELLERCHLYQTLAQTQLQTSNASHPLAQA